MEFDGILEVFRGDDFQPFMREVFRETTPRFYLERAKLNIEQPIKKLPFLLEVEVTYDGDNSDAWEAWSTHVFMPIIEPLKPRNLERSEHRIAVVVNALTA
ncbi:MAG: hypothetical protein H7144_14150 [Burkholderiales bacterium]|nr:hypothetical protein [Phycisphaerae bacterium]